MGLSEIIGEMNKKLKGDIAHLGVTQYDYERIPFTSPNMNYMTFGGLPKGKMIEFYGAEHGGKTTSALDIVANFQHSDDGRKVVYADLENTLDYVWATKLGVDVDNMVVISPTNQGAETLFEYFLQMIDTGEVGLVVIDSLGVMVSNQTLEKSVEEKTYGGIAMALTNFSKKAEMLCAKNNCTLIGINQMRDNLNSTYGGAITTGGRAWRHNVAVRIEFRQGSYFDEKRADLTRGATNPVGNFVLASLTKSKTCPPTRRVAQYTLTYAGGIDYLFDLVDVATKYGWIDKSGSWYTIVDPDTGEVFAKSLQGMSKVYEFLSGDENKAVLQAIEEYIDQKVKSND